MFKTICMFFSMLSSTYVLPSAYASNAAADVKMGAANARAIDRADLQSIKSLIDTGDIGGFFQRYTENGMGDDERKAILTYFFQKVKPSHLTTRQIEELCWIIHQLYRDNLYGKSQGKEGVLDAVLKGLPSCWQDSHTFMNGISKARSAIAAEKPATSLKTEADSNESVIVTKDPLAVAWKGLHPYEIVQRIIDQFERDQPGGLALTMDLVGYLKDKYPSKNYRFEVYLAALMLIEKYPLGRDTASDVFRNVIGRDSDLLPSSHTLPEIERLRLNRMVPGEIDSKEFNFAFKKALDLHKIVSVILPEWLLKELVGIVQQYGIVFGPSIAQILADPAARQISSYQLLFERGSWLKSYEVTCAMITDLYGLGEIVTNHPALQSVTFATNLIESLDLRDVPESMKELVLIANPIRTVIGDKVFPALERLDVSGCPLDCFPGVLCATTPNLRRLNLNNTWVPAEPMLLSIPDTIATIFPRLEELELAEIGLPDKESEKYELLKRKLRERKLKLESEPVVEQVNNAGVKTAPAQ